MHPLTHHDIIERVAPFSRSGRRVDLDATDRLARRLVFKPIERSGAIDVVEGLELQEIAAGRHRLVRTSTTADGLSARLSIDGADPQALLARIDAVEPQRHFDRGVGPTIVVSHRLDERNDSPRLVDATVRVGPLALTATIDGARARQADLGVVADMEMDLPDDLLAVLGMRWSVLRRTPGGWRGVLRLPRREPERTRVAEAELRRAAAHLVATLGEAPPRFHERWTRARWLVAARRAIPVLVCIGLIAGAAAVSSLDLGDSALRMLLFNVPPLLLVAFFCLRDLPQIVIPPLPRRSKRADWVASA